MQKLVDQGDPAAMRQLATMYFRGYGVDQDEQKSKQLCTRSIQLYKQQAKQNDSQALYALGEMYDGRVYCASTNEKKASRYFQKSADLGDPKALYAVAAKDGNKYQYKHGYDSISKPCQKAINTYEDLANKNNVDAQYELGMIYLDDKCVPQNFLKAFEWFKKAAENGHADAQYRLSRIYGRGVYLSYQNQRAYQDDEKYIEWLKKAAKNENGDAEYLIGKYYFFGREPLNVKKNMMLGLFYLQQAASHNNHIAQYALGIIYQGEKGIPKNRELSQKYYKLACANGSISACTRVGRKINAIK